MKSEKTAPLAFTLLILSAVIVTGYSVIAPAMLSRQYVSGLQSAAAPLKESYRQLEKSTLLPSDDIKTTYQHIEASRQQLEVLGAVVDDLRVLPYSDFLGQYNDARTLETRSRSFIAQSQEALGSYQALLQYLEVYTATVAAARSELDAFNAVVDLNNYEGQSEQVRLVAADIRAARDKLSAASYPGDMKPLHDATISAFSEAAEGFDDLAFGLAVPADALIYGAAHRIEQATLQLGSAAGKQYDDSVSQSRALKEIQDLEDKLELLNVPES